jgi:hypothetical protein
MKRHSTYLLLLLALLAFPQHAMANAGTPLIWATVFHLFFGNTLIGWGEGWLLSKLYQVPKLKSVLVMIAANYTSAWFGEFFVGNIAFRSMPLDLNNAWRWFWIMVFATYCMTLVLEWPFIAWCLRATQDWWRRSLKATIITQSASYIVLFGWYWIASGTSLYTQMNIVKPTELSLPESVLVYFINSEDGHVYKSHLPGTDRLKIYELHSSNSDDRLFTQLNAMDTNYWDLVARLVTADDQKPNLVNILTNMQVEATPDWRRDFDDERPSDLGPRLNFGRAQKLGSATNSHWEFRSRLWAIEGLQATDTTTRKTTRLAYETQFTAWLVRNAVQLPSDMVLFQLGDDQICIFEPASKKVALLWRGRGPVPVIEKNGSTK